MMLDHVFFIFIMNLLFSIDL